MPSPPQLIVLAGPNGAGKSTLVPHLLRDALGVHEFVNADTIATGLSGFSPDSVALEAGKIMLQRVQDLLESGRSFAIETTLSGRSWLKMFRGAKEQFGYEVTINYVWIDSAELAVDRVRLRTRHGAHFIPEETVRRRYRRSLDNFLNDYRELADNWIVYDNTTGSSLNRIAEYSESSLIVVDTDVWRKIESSTIDE